LIINSRDLVEDSSKILNWQVQRTNKQPASLLAVVFVRLPVLQGTRRS
jgi:hypothetical protein